VVFAAFGVDDQCVTEVDLPRLLRIVGALGALAVTAVALPAKVHLDALVEVSYDALGHER
jgi:hypothetical protein